MLWETSLLDADEVPIQWIQIGKNENRPVALVKKCHGNKFAHE
jgi:hypothetical protein